MSEYQADWFRDDDGAIDTEEFGDDDDGNSILDGSQSINGLAVDLATAAESKRMLRSFAKEDLEFPDEVDTPVDVAARVRFARYRALQSFRTSAWHSKENLPANYSRIFQFENVKSLQKR